MEPVYLTPLNYGKAAWLTRRRIARGLALLVALGAALSAIWWEPLLTHRLELAAYRRQCMNYRAPADQVVFEEDATALSRLAGLGGYESAVGGRLRLVPGCWTKEVPGIQTQGTLFLHARTSRGGRTRLVGLDVVVQPGMYLSKTGDVEDQALSTTVIATGNGLSRDVPVHASEVVLWVNQNNPRPMRYFAGQPDPGDASHFTFDYQRNGVRGTIDGYLNDDDTITLSPRQGIVSHSRLPMLWTPDVLPK